jgi:hypothetical protein
MKTIIAEAWSENTETEKEKEQRQESTVRILEL